MTEALTPGEAHVNNDLRILEQWFPTFFASGPTFSNNYHDSLGKKGDPGRNNCYYNY